MQIDLKKKHKMWKLLYIDALQRASAIKEAINNQVNRMILPNVAEMEIMHRLNSMGCYSLIHQGWSRYCCCWMFNVPTTENNAKHLIQFSRSTSNLVIIDYIECLFSKGQCFILTEINTIPDINLPFPSTQFHHGPRRYAASGLMTMHLTGPMTTSKSRSF